VHVRGGSALFMCSWLGEQERTFFMLLCEAAAVEVLCNVL
jgi:hypothetical protein